MTEMHQVVKLMLDRLSAEFPEGCLSLSFQAFHLPAWRQAFQLQGNDDHIPTIARGLTIQNSLLGHARRMAAALLGGDGAAAAEGLHTAAILLVKDMPVSHPPQDNRDLWSQWTTC